jgi:hypothetical protein
LVLFKNINAIQIKARSCCDKQHRVTKRILKIKTNQSAERIRKKAIEEEKNRKVLKNKMKLRVN